MEFESPEYLYLLLVLVPMVVWYVWKRKRQTASLQMSSTEVFLTVPKSSWKPKPDELVKSTFSMITKSNLDCVWAIFKLNLK